MRVKNHGSNQAIIQDKGCSVLYSYETPVALIVSSANRAYKTDRQWSVTTSRHINQWLRAEGFDPKEDATLVPQEILSEWQTSEFTVGHNLVNTCK